MAWVASMTVRSFGVPTLWAIGCVAVLAMAAVTFAADSVIIANAGVFAKGHTLQDTYFAFPHFNAMMLDAAALIAVFGFFAGPVPVIPEGYAIPIRSARAGFTSGCRLPASSS